MRVERGDHEAGAGDGDDEIDFVGLEACALEAFFRGFAAELDGVLHVLLIGLLEGAGLDRVGDGENGVAFVDLGIVHDAHHGLEFALGYVEYAAHVVLHVFARDGVFGHCGCRRDNRRVGRICVLRRRERGYAVSAQRGPLSPRRKSRPYNQLREGHEEVAHLQACQIPALDSTSFEAQ